MRDIRPRRAVSARSLSRRTAQVLNDIDEFGYAVAVVRFGRLVAVLAPFDGDKPAEPVIEDLELKEIDRRILRLIAEDSTQLWNPDQKPRDLAVPEVLASLTRLELAGLIEANLGRFRPTKLGRSVDVSASPRR